MTISDRSVRELACGLFDSGLGYKSSAGRLGVPARAVRQGWLTYRAVGRGALLDMGVLRTYDGEPIADTPVLKMMRELGLRCGIRRETDYNRYKSYRGMVG